jgi:glutathione S-transferase
VALLKLYHAAGTRADRVLALLQELGVEWELVPLDLAQAEQKRPEYLAIHPHGWVPALSDGDVTLFETAAICLYLADRDPANRLAPEPSSPERAAYYQWMIYAVATLEPALADVFLQLMKPEAERDPAVLASGRERFAASAEVLTRALGGPYLLTSGFSAADVLIGHMLIWADGMGLLAGRETLQAYAARIRARPSFGGEAAAA